MFQEFFKYVNIENDDTIDSPEQFLKKYSGYTFKDGLYRIHNYDEIENWNKIVTDVFQNFKDKITIFGYDWQGRQFGLNKDMDTVIMLDVDTGDVFDINVDIVEFHNEEIVQYNEDCLSSSSFDEWMSSEKGSKILHNQCVGYKVPLFLNGQDDIDNRELSDMEVYWGLMGQMVNSMFR